MERLQELETHITDHESFLSVQIEGLRHLILHPKSFKDEDDFKPLETQHKDPYSRYSDFVPPSTPKSEGHETLHHKTSSEHAPYHELHRDPSMSGWTITKYILSGVLIVGFGVGVYNWRQKKSRRQRYADEGSFSNSQHAHGGSLSAAMDSIGPVIGFRHRSKKMI